MYPELYQQMLNQTCCSDLPIPQALYQPGMVLLPRWTTVCQRIHLISPPQEFTRQQPKIFDRPRSQNNTSGRQFGPQVKQRFKRITCRPPPIIVSAVAEILDSMRRPPPNTFLVVALGHCWKAIGSGLFNIVPYGPLPNAVSAVAFGNVTQL